MAEAIGQFAASERAKPRLSPFCEQDASITLGLVLI